MAIVVVLAISVSCTFCTMVVASGVPETPGCPAGDDELEPYNNGDGATETGKDTAGLYTSLFSGK